jgi:flagellar hook assembly protein FlgD
VTTVFDGKEAAGVHSVIWDGADKSGKTVASGVYLYRITSPAFSAEKKMILMK